MGLLDQVIGSVVGQVLGGDGKGQAVSPIVKALLMLLMSRGAGGLGEILGGGGRAPSPEPPPHGGGSGDLGGFGEAPRGGPPANEGEFGDLAGMLDGPGERAPEGRSPGAGPYAKLDQEPPEPSGSGLDGLIESFGRSGLGDVIESWIGGGRNREIAPSRLADALGSDTVDTLSRQTGLDRDALLGQLAQALPGVIDGLTPRGRRPDAEDRRGW